MIKGGNKWEIEVDGNRRKKLNYKKVAGALIVLLLVTISIIVGIFLGINAVKDNGERQAETKQEEKVLPDDITINLVATGDTMCHTTNFNAAYNSKDKTYDFTSVFANIAKYISKADIAIRKSRDNICGRRQRIYRLSYIQFTSSTSEKH